MVSITRLLRENRQSIEDRRFGDSFSCPKFSCLLSIRYFLNVLRRVLSASTLVHAPRIEAHLSMFLRGARAPNSKIALKAI